jgi:hypothetical protein
VAFGSWGLGGGLGTLHKKRKNLLFLKKKKQKDFCFWGLGQAEVHVRERGWRRLG